VEQIADNYSMITAMTRQVAGRRFAAVVVSFMALAALLAGWLPLQLSIATVFLFAGPHNLMEFRYFLSRTPVRLARSRNFFLLSGAGVAVLAAFHVGLTLLASKPGWSEEGWLTSIAVWNGLLIGWVVALMYIRSRQTPRFDWTLALPVGLALLAADVLEPQLWGILLVYLHPVLALWFLDRQLRRTRPEWLRAYRMCLILVPFVLVIIWLRLSAISALAADNGLALRIALHAGADLLPQLNAGAVVATHAFLETLHYGIWIFALPILGLQSAPWRTDSIPLVRHRLGRPRLVAILLTLGGFAVVLLWVCFLLDYSKTRDVYFTVAIVHVLVEVPFLIRMA
jgi:hypothetical protein